MTVIYIDMLLALNLFIDFLLLCATARVLQLPNGRWRTVGGAAVGAASSLLILLPPLSALLSLGWKLAAAALMVLTAFPWRGMRLYLKETAVLFVISAVFAGVCFGAWYFLAPAGLVVQSGIVYYDVPPLWLVALVTLSYGVLCLYDRLTRKRAALGCCFHVEIRHGGDVVRLNALLDSGHSLRDSFSGSPVILVKETAVKAFHACYDLAQASSPGTPPIRYIPYSSIGGEGLLIAFRPQTVLLHSDDRTVDISGVWIAPTIMLKRDDYEALIGPAVADLTTHSQRSVFNAAHIMD